MRQISVNVYKFSELSDKSKDKAIQDYASGEGYLNEEAFASIRALAEHFGGKVTDYSVDFFQTSHSYMKFQMPDSDEMTKTEIHLRLRQLGKYNHKTGRGVGECKLTGYCSDEDCIDGFRAEWRKGERDLGKLMQGAFKTWLEACQDDLADFYTHETFGEHCEANEYEFYESGKMR